MSSLLDKLKASREFVKTVAIGDVVLGMRILTERDYQDAGWAANALLDEFKTELKPSNADLFESEKATQLLQRFIVDPETKKPLFSSAEEVLASLTRSDRNFIGAAYFDFEREYSPSERTMSPKEFDALVEEVKKKPDTPRLNDLSGAMLKKLVSSLAARLSD
jgi:hypothetical protein